MEKVAKIIIDILKEERENLKWLEIEELGYRYYLKSGESYGCPTSPLWFETDITKELCQIMKNYLSKELKNLSLKKHDYVTRAKDHKMNSYFEYLAKLNLYNSVGIYKFYPDLVESYFFIFVNKTGDRRDELHNNREALELSISRLSRRFRDEFHNLSTNPNFQFVLDEETTNLIFNHGGAPRKTKYVYVHVNGSLVELNSREVDTLQEICYGASNRSIASKLHLNTKTIEKYIFSLKNKFDVNSRHELAELARIPKIQQYFNRNIL